MVLESFSQLKELVVGEEEVEQVHCYRWFVSVLASLLHLEEVEGEELEAPWEIPGRAYPLRQLPKSPQETLLVDYYYYC